jgi:hypothetical protein
MPIRRMDANALSNTLAALALFLGATQGRLATVLSRASHPTEDGSLGAYTPIPILIAWLAVMVWAFKSWSWYWIAAAIVVFAFASGPLVSSRTLAVWMPLRLACALVIIGAAAVLWIRY